jgi:hypothetical protein
MDLTELVRQYVKTRDNFVARIGRITGELNAWTDEHADAAPTLTDIAQFEGLRAQRSRLLSEFTEAEDEFVVEMLRSVSSAQRHG